jgi:predicted amidohydrolase
VVARERAVRIGAVQLDVVGGDPDATTKKVCSWVDEAAGAGVDLVLFPELVMAGGYSLGEGFREVAEAADGPRLARVRERAARHGMHVIVGFAESGKGGSIYNSAAICGPDGSVLGVYRKTHIFSATESFFAPGDELSVFDVDFGRIGIPICYDLEFPEPARVLCLAGAEVLLSMAAHWEGTGTVGTPEGFIRTIYSARALENRTPVALCNRVGYDEGLGDRFIGLSRIVDSGGEVVAAMSDDSEGMITALIDLDHEREKRESYDYISHRLPHLYAPLVEVPG